MKSDLKLLAQKAKNRLKIVGEATNNSSNPTKSMALSHHEYAIIATRIRVEDDPLFNKVSKMLAKDPDITNPIGELINKNEYNLLTEAGKQRYILNLAKRYNKIKEKIPKILRNIF